MKTLHVLYDSQCGLCLRCRRWLEAQSKFVDLAFIPRNSPEIPCRFPGFNLADFPEELVVISDEGGVWCGASAWVMCLYALEDWREWSERLAHPRLLPLARKACEVISRNRHRLSGLLGLANDDELAGEIRWRHEN